MIFLMSLDCTQSNKSRGKQSYKSKRGIKSLQKKKPTSQLKQKCKTVTEERRKD